MASRKMTFSIADRLAVREKRLIRACEIANEDPEIREIEKELDGLMDETPEPWGEAPAAMRSRGRNST